MADGEKDSPQGPTDPHGPGGIDAPAPPGGPQRTDTPASSSGSGTSGAGQQDEPERHPEAVHRDDDTEPRTERGERGLQEENAETSLDQPSQ